MKSSKSSNERQFDKKSTVTEPMSVFLDVWIATYDRVANTKGTS